MMKKAKKTAAEDIQRFFLDDWMTKNFRNFLDHCVQFFKIYGTNEEEWSNTLANLEERQAAMLFTAYFMSRIADLHAGNLARLKCEYPKLWKRIEDEYDLDTLEKEVE